MEKIVTVKERGMVPIPPNLARKLNIKDGTKLVVREHGAGLLYIPIVDIEEFFGKDSKELGYSIIKEIYEDRRREGAREEISREERYKSI
jgi:bifunctional DNA-binding transcriptional regulator/antitoxin component of YhaV-PrlF toxin-antitoxin module